MVIRFLWLSDKTVLGIWGQGRGPGERGGGIEVLDVDIQVLYIHKKAGKLKKRKGKRSNGKKTLLTRTFLYVHTYCMYNTRGGESERKKKKEKNPVNF